MAYKLSPSSLGLIKECPRCFWLEQNGKWRRPEGIFPSLPSGMDRILKKHFDSFRDRGKLPPELFGCPDCEGINLFGSNEDEKELLETWRDSRKGIQTKDCEGNILKGAVDNILINGKKLIVLDYKTRGYALKDDTHKYYQDQIDIYNFLLNENGYETEDYGYLLFYYPEKVLETGEVIFETKLVKMNVNPENGMKLFKEAVEFLKGKCPDVRRENACRWCCFVGN